MKNKLLRRIMAVWLAGIMVFSCAACGKDAGGGDSENSGSNGGNHGSGENNGGGTGGVQNAGGKEDNGDYVYIPAFYDLPANTEAAFASYSNAAFVGDRLYYMYTAYQNGASSNEWCYIDTTSLGTEPVVLLHLTQYETWGEDSVVSVIKAAACEDGGTLLLLNTVPLIPADATDEEYARQQRETTYNIKKLAEDGTVLFDKDVTQYLQMASMDSMYGMIDPQMFADKEGGFYISDKESYIWVFDKEGNHTADIDLSRIQGYVAAVNILPDGRIGVLHQGSGMQLSVPDIKTGQVSETYANLPSNCYNSNLGTGPNGGVLLNGNGILYEYSMETKEYRELVRWVDCNISGDNVQQVAMLADGRLAVYSADWSTNTNSLALMEKVPASEMEAKEILTLGCMNASPNLQAAVVEFNKTNTEYEIEIKSYGESVDASAEDAYEDAYEDARALFYSDIMTGNAPDMFVAGDVDMNLFAVKGLITDLSPYLDGSTVVGREDLFESILNAYTVDGTLCAIPTNFGIQTLAGRAAEVGTKSGWTLAEMIAFAEAHPETPILPNATKVNVLAACMMFDFASWVNWESGECSFDTPEFKAVMEFANRYPEKADESLPLEQVQIMEHMALLHPFGLNTPQSWQLETAIFHEPITAIGYPSAGGNGVLAFGNDAVCISTTSQKKEAAWSFIETLLTEEAQENDKLWSIPVRISAFEKHLEEAMEPSYLYDDNGEVVMDEDGNPVQRSLSTYRWSDGFEVNVYAVTKEEADEILHVISQIDGIYEYDASIMDILLEEIAPYFAGQKSVDEAAGIIQSRVQLYINENR
ncbi:MAG: extracellular solute-binding protein [Lachnospiraceae bacterium]